ncbi:MAG: peptidase, partial [Acidobacteriota bacterium]|nr:peptidase [Acidobacteriota bacterium]
AGGDEPDAPQAGGRGGRGGLQMAQYNAALRDPARRDPRVYIIPSSQADFPTATKFINTLRYVGVEVHQASAPLVANGKTYPAGSYVVKTAQAGRAHVLDMFEPQDHPNDFDERGIPRRPYDSAGWTLAYQMGVQFDRLMDDVKGTLTEIQGLAKPVPGTITGTAAAGYLISPAINDAYTVANRVLKAKGDVFRTGTPATVDGAVYPVGSFYVAASATTTPIVQAAAKELGVNMHATSAGAGANATKLTDKRIALWDTQTGSMPSGWTRYMLERFEFPYTIVCGAGFDDADLKSKYDVIIMPSGASVRAGGGGGRGAAPAGAFAAPTAPAPQPSDPDLRSLCQVTTGTGNGATAEANVRKFVEAGGTVVAAGSAAEAIAASLQLPVTEYLVERQPGQPDRPLGSDKFYVPGSIVRVAVDKTAPSALGSEDHVDVYFNNSPVFRLQPNAVSRGIRPVMWFDTDSPLRSGWAWGQNYLEGGTAAFEATVGKGKVLAFGPEITFRAQPHGTFKFLMNGIHSK